MQNSSLLNIGELQISEIITLLNDYKSFLNFMEKHFLNVTSDW